MLDLETKLLDGLIFTRERRCWEWQHSLTWNGYGRICTGNKSRRASRVAYELFCGPIPDGLSVLHTCDNPRCCNPTHLFVGTTRQNMEDRNAKGRTARGSKNGTAKLTEKQVAEIRVRFGRGETKHGLARAFGVGTTTITRTVTSKVFAHVPDVESLLTHEEQEVRAMRAEEEKVKQAARDAATEAEHEPAELLHVGRFATQGGTSLGGRRWNVWHNQMRCPVCGREFTRLANIFRGRGLRCIGRDELITTTKKG